MSTPAAAAVHAAPVIRRSLFARLVRNPMGLGTMLFLSIITILAITAPYLGLLDPNVPDAMKIMAAPDATHLLGTDSAGRDVLSRLVYGSQTTLISALVVVVTSIIIGVPSGLIAGYYGGKFDAIASWISNMIMSLPAMIVLLAFRIVVGPSITLLMVMFGILIAPG